MTPQKHERYEIQNPEIQQLLRELGEKIGAEIPAGWGFALLIFEFSPGEQMFYISNAQRQDMTAAMLEFVKRHGGVA